MGFSRGQRDPDALAQLAKGALRSKIPALVEALDGTRFSAQHALLIGGILRHIDFLDTEIAALGDAIEAHFQADREREDSERPFELAVQIACSLDGILATHRADADRRVRDRHDPLRV